MTLSNKRIKNIETFKKKTGNAPDVTYKDYPIKNKTITLIYANSVSSSVNINDFILRRLDEDKNDIDDKNIFNYIKNFIPNNASKEVNKINEALYYLFSGFTVVLFDDVDKAIVFENRAILTSPISRSENEKSLKGPSDAFCENYQMNIGLLRRKLKTHNLWFKEAIVGEKSKTKVSLFYLNDICNKKLVNDIYEKINNIEIDYVGNTNYIIDKISNTNRSIFPTTLSTERPDYAVQKLTEGRIILMIENSNEVIILPCLFFDFLKNPEDYYEKTPNTFLNRIIRSVSFFLALLTPAIYISLMAFNIEAIPSGLLINLSIQKDGVPFSTVFEILVMSFMFQILRESDLRFPGKGSSSISIVGALVLGQAAVEAGIVSPITIIIVGISAVSSLAFNSIELINSLRWWQLIFILLAYLFGFIGVMFGLIIMFAFLVSTTSLGKPYFEPFEPFTKNLINDGIFLKKSFKFNPKNIFNKEDNNEKDN